MSQSLAESMTSRMDPVSQYLHMKQEFGKENLRADNMIEISADTSRVYFPTQRCSSTFRVKQELFAKGCSVIRAEFKGEIHSYAIVSTGQSTYVSTATNDIFSYEIQLFNAKSPASSSNAHISAREVNAPGSASHSGSSNLAGSFREWEVSSVLPEMGTVKRRGVEMQAPLPSTFRDHRRSHNGINYIFYGWKLTAEMKGLLKKNKKFYLPILVLPLSQRQHQMPLEPTPGLPGYAHASQGVSAFRDLPQGWKFERLESRIKKGLIFSRGRIELKFSSPPVSSVSMTSPLPFLLSIKVSSSDRANLDPASESSILPELPLQGAGESHPKFELRRKDVSKGTSGINKSYHTVSLDVEWGDGHLLSGRGVGVGMEAQNSQFKEIVAFAAPWSEPSLENSSPEATTARSSYPKEKKLSGKELDDSDSDSVSSDEDEETKKSLLSKLKLSSKGKGKEKHQDHDSSQGSFVTTSTISGFLPTFFTPAISVNHIKTAYTLRLRWKNKGLGNDLRETFREVDLDSLQGDVGLREIADFGSDVEGLSSKALGFRSQWLRTGFQGFPNEVTGGSPHEDLEVGVDALRVTDETPPSYTFKG